MPSRLVPMRNASRLVLVGGVGRGQPAGAATVLSASALRARISASSSGTIWVSRNANWIPLLVESRLEVPPDQRLLLLGELSGVTRSVLSKWFRQIVVAEEGVFLLKTPELLEALGHEDRDDLVIGGAYDRKSDAVVLYRGSLESLVVPVSWFQQGRRGRRADLAKMDIIDYGQTIRILNYEIATSALLYEFDVEFRRRARKRAVDNDGSLGGSIRRLRLQKRLTQSDFSIPLKTIARIERGEVSKPQTATLRAIAKRLGVAVEELGTY